MHETFSSQSINKMHEKIKLKTYKFAIFTTLQINLVNTVKSFHVWKFVWITLPAYQQQREDGCLYVGEEITNSPILVVSAEEEECFLIQPVSARERRCSSIHYVLAKER
jgi:hypothetical protein